MDDKITVTESADAPPGVYWMKITAQEKFDGHWQPARRLYFELDPRYKIKGHITGIFPEMATKGNKTGVLIRACFGECLVGADYTWSKMIGCKMYGEIEQTDTANGLFSRVKKIVWPPPQSMTAESIVPQQEPANIDPWPQNNDGENEDKEPF